MNFKEAMIAAQKGAKVTRQGWKGSLHFEMENDKLVSKQPVIETYPICEEVFLSDGWVLENDEKESILFYDLIPFLQKGRRAKLKDWVDSWIKYDVSSRCIVYEYRHNRPYFPPFEAFTATDWITV